MSARRERGRLYIFGWDGADWAVIEEGWRRGKLPVLRRLADDGQRGVLRSTNPPLTPPAWTSFITGTNPGVHGIFGFITIDPTSYRRRILPGGARRVSSLWSGLDRAGLRTAMITVPWTYPAESLEHGVVIPGWDAPDETFDSTHPPEMARILASEVGSVPRKTSIRLVNLKPTTVLAAQQAKLRTKERICRLVIERREPDVFMVVYTEPDSAGHWLWTRGPIPDGLIEAYEQVDASMGRLIEDHVRPEDAVLVVSDHGTVPIHTYVHMGALLASAGFLRLAASPTRSGLATLKREVWGRVPATARGRLTRYAPGWLRTAGDRTRTRARVDWGGTVAFPVGTELVSLGVGINTVDRYRSGLVPPEDYAEVREEVREFLRGIRDPQNGRTVFPTVDRREDIYEGPALGDAPDLVVSFTEGYGVRSGLMDTRWISREPFGAHRSQGVYLARPALGLGETEHIEHILPKVLIERGFPAETGSPLDQRVPTAYSPEEEQEIEARLRHLGYME